MEFALFAHHLSQLETERSRLKITSLLAVLLSQLDPTEVKVASYLLQGQLTPSYQTLEFQLSVKMILRALARIKKLGQTTGTDLFGQSVAEDIDAMSQLYKQVGDIGALSAQVTSVNPAKSHLSLIAVYDLLVAIARASGPGSQETKLALLTTLLSQVDGQSAKVIARIIVGRLRLGFSTLTMFDALSVAVTGDKSEREALLEAYGRRADLGELASFYLGLRELTPDKRLAQLQVYDVKLGIPLLSALCQRLESTTDMVAKMGQVLAEPKYDGLRAQLHYDGQSVQVFSRNLENVTAMFPEAQQLMADLKCQNCILDSEVIGVEEVSGQLKRFQETATRKRKHDIAGAAQAVPVKFFIFDLMYLDGVSLLDRPLTARKSLLARHVRPQTQTPAELTQFITTTDPTELKNYHETQLSAGLEGMVVKQADSVYRSGRTGWRWVKIKETEGAEGKLSDTVDVVVMGYYLGRGKRTSFGLGAVLVGVLDPNNQVVSLAKIGTGMSENQLTELKNLCQELATDNRPASYQPVEKLLTPDVWINPGLVLEVAGDELTTSSQHAAGLALRFPRLVKIRTDKTWQDATSVGELKTMLDGGVLS